MFKIIKKQKINGLLLLDKSIGITSNKILQYVKIIFNAQKAGYIGTLDPLASGLLPICFGEYTKFSQYLMNQNKTYLVTALLGEKTNTADKYGFIIKKKNVNLTIKNIFETLNSFKGISKQKPPMYSAIKYKGIPLYKYARRGINIPNLKERIIKIYQIKLINFYQNKIKLQINCSKGTYIRSIIDDLGDQLNCGAHIIKLRRIAISHISIFHKNVITLEQLKILMINYQNHKLNVFLIKKLLLPIDYIIYHIPKLYLSNILIKKIINGEKIKLTSIIDKTQFCIFEKKKFNFIGICQINNKGYIVKCKLMNSVKKFY
ncbi:tRNA pseudouridine(55) synthase TruB [Enterobacteriaceae endosymbiont of Donacia cincticornis]|uniref:tRNA pseudouridine(55) synthase TruB n=1 Tax=Enterobacteriaceae endosymbiont of Donacia cincticornis TaxID=2675773 RepID=UPI00144902F8|nr:tRNA pseudouridine(55) synthase TruB [Enterobacteriaceae endosymbiont of Donacia cincticornis]QJC36184.1 tRNA pseudouridine(55) synthase TruB [Enterobacteriaceae endosymbiont of Donacia cincticornis]